MRLILLILFCCVSVFSQTDTKIDEKEITKSFAEKTLKDANWVKVTSDGSVDFYVDAASLKREKNAVDFYVKLNKRGNLDYTLIAGDCQTDVYIIRFGFSQVVDEELKFIPPLPTGGFGSAKNGTVMVEMLNYACTEGAKKKEK